MHQACGVWFRCYVNPKHPAEAILYRDLPGIVLSFRLDALSFGGFGSSLLTFLMLARRSGRQEALARRIRRNPGCGKRIRASGSIRGSAVSLWFPLLGAAFWNTLIATMWCAFLCNRTGRADEEISCWFLTPFTIVGLGMIVWAVVSVMRSRAFGRSVFQMASVPGVIGGQLAGVIRTSVKIGAEHAFRARLTCVNCVTSRDCDSILRNIVWQDEQLVQHDLLEGDASHSAIPVLFQIPYECRPTDDHDPNSLIFWRLEVTAKTPGLEDQTEFEVPVFKTPQSDPHFVVDRGLIAKYAAQEDPDRDLSEAGVVRTSSPSGDGCRFIFPWPACQAPPSHLHWGAWPFSACRFLCSTCIADWLKYAFSACSPCWLAQCS